MLNILIDSLDHPFFGYYKNEYRKDEVFDRNFLTTEDLCNILIWEYNLGTYHRFLDMAHELGFLFSTTHSFNKRKKKVVESVNIPLNDQGLYFISYLIAKEQERYWEQVKERLAFVIVLDSEGNIGGLLSSFNIESWITRDDLTVSGKMISRYDVEVDDYPVTFRWASTAKLIPIFKDTYSPANFQVWDRLDTLFIKTMDYSSLGMNVGTYPRGTISLNVTEYIRNWFNREPYLTLNNYQEKVAYDAKYEQPEGYIRTQPDNLVQIPEWMADNLKEGDTMTITETVEYPYTLERMVDKKENEKAYKAFQEYLVYRSLEVISKRLSIALNVLEKWHKKYFWDERMYLHDTGVNKDLNEIINSEYNCISHKGISLLEEEIVKAEQLDTEESKIPVMPIIDIKAATEAFNKVGLDLNNYGLINKLNEKVEKANKQAYDAGLRLSELEYKLNCLEERFSKYNQDTKKIIDLLLDNNELIDRLPVLVAQAIDNIPQQSVDSNEKPVEADPLPRSLVEAQTDKKNFAKKSLEEIEQDIEVEHPGYRSVIGWAVKNKQRYAIKFDGIAREIGRLCHIYCDRYNIKQLNIDLKGDGKLVGFYPSELIKTVIEGTDIIQKLSENPISTPSLPVAKLNHLQINQYLKLIHDRLSTAAFISAN